MKMTLRLIVSLVVTVGTVAAFSAFLQVRQERDQMRNEMERRARLLAEGLQETVAPLVQQRSSERLRKIVERFGNRERLAGVAVFDVNGDLLAGTNSLGASPVFPADLLDGVFSKNLDGSRFELIEDKERHIYAMPLRLEESTIGAFVVYQGASHIRRQLFIIYRNTFLRVLVQVFLISLVTLVIVR
jgi:hypothetical protein